MATYKGIQGYTVQKLSDDPTASEAAGQLWYNSTSGKFKVGTEGAGAWAEGGTLNTGRKQTGSAGTQGANLIFGNDPNSGVTESYDGSSWTTVNSMTTNRRGNPGLGIQTAAMAAGIDGASPSTKCETYDGTSWTEGADLNTARNQDAGTCGIEAAGLCVAGAPALTNTEEYNGTSWSSVNNLLNGRQSAAIFGVQTSAIYAGGEHPPSVLVESYDGTSWTATTALGSSRQRCMSGGATNPAGLIAGGTPDGGGALTATTEKWDGTSWTEVGDLATARQSGGGMSGGASSASTSIASGGLSSGPTASVKTEEWSEPVYTIKTVTVS